MADKNVDALSSLVTKHEAGLLQTDAGSLRSGQIKEDELTDQSRRFLREFAKALKSGQVDDITGPAWSAVRDLLDGFSRSRALQGFTPSETAKAG
jgi:rsbT co-antagonist protein RsbR